MWSEGTIGIPDANIKDKYKVCHYWVKHYEEGLWRCAYAAFIFPYHDCRYGYKVYLL